MSRHNGDEDTSKCLYLNHTIEAKVPDRAYALQKHRPLTLQATIGLPTVDDEPSDSISGFIHLVHLYRPFDETFVCLWNKSTLDCTTRQLAYIQHQLKEALPADLRTTETQVADLRTSQQWLRTMVWQLSISKGFLSSASPDTSMTFRYPIEIAKDLVTVTGRLSQHSMEVHGIGLVVTIDFTNLEVSNSCTDREGL